MLLKNNKIDFDVLVHYEYKILMMSDEKPMAVILANMKAGKEHSTLVERCDKDTLQHLMKAGYIFDLLIIEQHRVGMNYNKLLKKINKSNPEMEMVFCIDPQKGLNETTLTSKAIHVLNKPVSNAQLKTAISMCYYKTKGLFNE